MAPFTGEPGIPTTTDMHGRMYVRNIIKVIGVTKNSGDRHTGPILLPFLPGGKNGNDLTLEHYRNSFF